MDVDLGYKYIEIFRGGVDWSMMENEDFISSISFKFKKRNLPESIIRRKKHYFPFISQGNSIYN